MAHAVRGLDPRIAGLPVHDQELVGLDVGRTWTKITVADASGIRYGTPRQIPTANFVGVGVTEAVVQLMQDLPRRTQFGGLTVAGKLEDDGTIVPTNISELGRIYPEELAAVTGVQFTLCNDVVAFVQGTTRTDAYEVLKPATGPTWRTKKSPIRSGLFLTSGTNSASARFVPVLGVWVPLPAETGWPGLQPEMGNLMEAWFLQRFGLPKGEVGAELMVSLGTGILNWHEVLRDAPDTVLNYYVDQVCMARLRPHVLRPSNEFLAELDAAPEDDKGRVFDQFTLAGDPYAEMVMTALAAAQGAYCREVALANVPDVSEGLWINSPMLVNPEMRNWVITRTPFLRRFVSPNAVGNGRRFADYLEALPIYVVTDRYVVPAGAAANVGAERIINGEVVGYDYGPVH